jgi:hypothetical protein
MSETRIGATQYLTLGEVARQLGESESRTKYAISTYRIEPTARVGILRCWTEADLPRIRSALARVAARRGGRL